MVVDNKFNIGDTVYLKTDKDQLPRIVTSIRIFPTGVCYCLSQGTTDTIHYEIEISEEINIVYKTTE